jgi:UDP-N-acetylglucosamine 2-epimerase
MRPKLSGNILFVFSDPGGAKPCLSLIEENNLLNAIVVSDRQYSFYKDFKTSVKVIYHNFEQVIEAVKPDLIFTGTSYTSDIEKQFIKIAKIKKIPCYSFVDHWTSISNRFVNAIGELVLPDKVWVIDERAQQIAIRDGIDKTKIVISGNPYHDWLRNWKPSISKEVFLKQLGLQHMKKKLLLYAPDPLSNANGLEIYGFDELSATSTLTKIFKKHQKELKEWKVLIKVHPNQDREKLFRLIEEHETFYILPEETDANASIFYADIVMGFFSSFLIESFIMNKPVLRFLKEKSKPDPISELNIGMVVNKNTLVTTLSKYCSRPISVKEKGLFT